jgi:cation diffusion facilitator family transporter
MHGAAPSPLGLERKRAVVRVMFVVLAVNVLIAVGKLVLAELAGSVSLHADGVHSLIDGSSNVIAMVGLRFASAPPDRGHPYGHRKIETLAALAVGVFVSLGGLEVGLSLYQAIVDHHVAAHPDLATVIGVLFAATLGLSVSRYEAARGRALGSEVLGADAGHTLSDALGALTVLASLGLVRLGIHWADLAGGLVVLALIARTAWRIFRENVGVMADEARLDPVEVRSVALAVPGVEGAHKVRSRGTLDEILVDLHIHVDPESTITEAHRLSHKVKDAIMARFKGVADVVVHAEPADGRQHEEDEADEGA